MPDSEYVDPFESPVVHNDASDALQETPDSSEAIPEPPDSSEQDTITVNHAQNDEYAHTHIEESSILLAGVLQNEYHFSENDPATLENEKIKNACQQ